MIAVGRPRRSPISASLPGAVLHGCSPLRSPAGAGSVCRWAPGVCTPVRIRLPGRSSNRHPLYPRGGRWGFLGGWGAAERPVPRGVGGVPVVGCPFRVDRLASVDTVRCDRRRLQLADQMLAAREQIQAGCPADAACPEVTLAAPLSFAVGAQAAQRSLDGQPDGAAGIEPATYRV
jgi:hypothetical protein